MISAGSPSEAPTEGLGKAIMFEGYDRNCMNKDELINVGLIVVFGGLIGASTAIYRGMLPTIFSADLIELHYSIAHVLIGTMPILFLQADTPQGRATAIFFFLAVFITVAVSPVRVVLNGMIGATVLFGSVAYFRFFTGKSTHFLAAIAFLLVEMYGYTIWIMGRAYLETQDLLFILPPVFTTVMVGLLLKTLRTEYRKAMSGSAGSQGWGL
ncbi:hypothetical protein DVK07_05650 [Halorubrum sp. Atlit-26R]|nr:hypothetical protein DVK07_05650 [Halorubrum sp. Atlit-26R]